MKNPKKQLNKCISGALSVVFSLICLMACSNDDTVITETHIILKGKTTDVHDQHSIPGIQIVIPLFDPTQKMVPPEICKATCDTLITDENGQFKWETNKLFQEKYNFELWLTDINFVLYGQIPPPNRYKPDTVNITLTRDDFKKINGQYIAEKEIIIPLNNR